MRDLFQGLAAIALVGGGRPRNPDRGAARSTSRDGDDPAPAVDPAPGITSPATSQTTSEPEAVAVSVDLAGRRAWLSGGEPLRVRSIGLLAGTCLAAALLVGCGGAGKVTTDSVGAPPTASSSSEPTVEASTLTVPPGGPSDIDIRVLEVLAKLGVKSPESKLRKLYGQIGGGGAASSGDTITEADGRDALDAIARLPIPPGTGGEVLDQESTRRVVKAVLRATSRSALVHPVNVLRAASGASLEVKPGTKMVLDVRGSWLTIDGKKEDLRPMDLDSPSKTGESHYYLDIVYKSANGKLVAAHVLDSFAEVDNPRTAARVTRTGPSWANGGTNRELQIRVTHEGGSKVLATPVDGIVRLPSEVVRDFDQLVPSELHAEFKEAFRKPGTRRTTKLPESPNPTYAVVSVVPPGKPAQLISQRTSGNGDHAEDVIIRGDVEEAVRSAAGVGTKDIPALVAISLNRSPCGGCATTLADAWTAATAQRANVIGVVAMRTSYEPRGEKKKKPVGTKGGTTSPSDLAKLRDAGLMVVALSVDGQTTQKGRWIGDSELRAGKPSGKRPPTLEEFLADIEAKVIGPDGRPYTREQLRSMGGIAPSSSDAATTNVFDGPASAALDPAQPLPGGIDFGTLELRYLADVGVGEGVRYALQAKVSADGRSSGDGLAAAQTASDAFFVWLALPPTSFTVNLNPARPNDILDAQLARTDAGRILLEADLRLKKTTAALINPSTDLGGRVWGSLRYAEGAKRCVSFRTWIEPGVATVRATENELFILDAPLSVQRESAYLHKFEGQVASKTCPEQDAALELHNEKVLQTMLLPKISEAVNLAPEFQDLRSVYLSRVAAQWVRDRNATKPTVYSDIIDSGNIDRWTARLPWDPMEVFGRYVKSFNEKEFRVEEKTVIDGGRAVQTTIRSYGGVDFSTVPQVDVGAETFASRWSKLPATVTKSLDETTRDPDGRRLWLAGTRPRAEASAEPWREPNDDAYPNRRGGFSFPTLVAFSLIVVGWSLLILRSVRSEPPRDRRHGDSHQRRKD